MLRGVRTVPVDGAALKRSSRLLPLEVRSLDAIHLDAALQLHDAGEVAAVLTFDHQLQGGCRAPRIAP